MFWITACLTKQSKIILVCAVKHVFVLMRDHRDDCQPTPYGYLNVLLVKNVFLNKCKFLSGLNINVEIQRTHGCQLEEQVRKGIPQMNFVHRHLQVLKYTTITPIPKRSNCSKNYLNDGVYEHDRHWLYICLSAKRMHTIQITAYKTNVYVSYRIKKLFNLKITAQLIQPLQSFCPALQTSGTV